MWESLLAEVLKNVVVPELAEYIRRTYQSTGKWPTKEELEARVDSIAGQIRTSGEAFLNRKVGG